jgi:hypothetical protein
MIDWQKPVDQECYCWLFQFFIKLKEHAVDRWSYWAEWQIVELKDQWLPCDDFRELGLMSSSSELLAVLHHFAQHFQ